MAVGFCQLLDRYAAASLCSQHLRFFPTSVLKEVLLLKQKLIEWKEECSWESSELFHASIGSPKTIVENLKAGSYSPNVTNGVRSALARMRVRSNNDGQIRNELEHDWEHMAETITLMIQETSCSW